MEEFNGIEEFDAVVVILLMIWFDRKRGKQSAAIMKSFYKLMIKNLFRLDFR